MYLSRACCKIGVADKRYLFSYRMTTYRVLFSELKKY